MNGGQKMKNSIKRRLIPVILITLLLVHTAAAAEIPLPVRLLTGDASIPVRIRLSEPEVRKLSQFDDPRTEHLNRLIRHLAIDMEVDQETSRTAVLIDQKEAFSWIQKEENTSIQKIYSFDPAVIHTDKNESEGQTDSDDLVVFLEQNLIKGSQYIDQFYLLFAAVPDAFAERARTEKTELRFSGFGKAVKRVTVSFPADYVQDNFPGVLADAAGSEDCKKTISGLVFSGSQKIGLLFDENGRIVRITYDGKVGKTQDSLRKVALVWKCLREDNHLKDSISLKTPAITGADKDNIALERELDSRESSSGSYIWDIQIDHRAGKEDRKLTRFSAGLTSNEALISGNLEYILKRDGKETKIKIVPDIKEENDGEYKGTLEIDNYSGKIEKNSFIVHIELQECEHLSRPGTGAVATETDLSQPDPKDNEGQGKAEDIIAGIVIQKLFELPEEDLLYFSNGIPTDIWTRLIQ